MCSATSPRCLRSSSPTSSFNALHGPFGEDGCIQGVLEILGIPYTHSGVLASALAMNKEKAKSVAAAAGIPVAEHRIVSALRGGAWSMCLPPPYVVKPIAEGSSFGVIIVPDDQAHPPQSLGRDDWTFGDEVMVERYIAGRELTCAVHGRRGARRHRDRAARARLLRLRREIRRGRIKTRSVRLRLNPLFTKIFARSRLKRIVPSAAAASPAPTSATTRREPARSIWLEVNTQPGMTRTFAGSRARRPMPA